MTLSDALGRLARAKAHDELSRVIGYCDTRLGHSAPLSAEEQAEYAEAKRIHARRVLKVAGA
jgi:hypothetical protein